MIEFQWQPEFVRSLAQITGSPGDDTLTGTAGNDTLAGLAGNDSLRAVAGDDLLDGGAGVDTLVGGGGNDTFLVDDPLDVVVELRAQGSDTVHGSVSMTLATNVENLLLLGSVALRGTGNRAANVLTGNTATNTSLIGGAGDDTLDASAGVHRLYGGYGDDAYVVQSSDKLTERAGAGIDTVFATTAFTLGANFENLVLSGQFARRGVGNELANRLTGNANGNELDGKAGADTMAGGAGMDWYVVDDSGDLVVENPGEGNDVVETSLSYTLPPHVENLQLFETNAIDCTGTGNDLDNQILGNRADNTLIGGAGNDSLGGGYGEDVLIGGPGDDRYYHYYESDASDVYVELAAEGIDTIYSDTSYTLGANFEILRLWTSDPINGKGNAEDNLLIGNWARNNLKGALGDDTLDGGDRPDRLYGGYGDDTYILEDADIVTEAPNAGTDTVRSPVDYTLPANVENLVLTTTGSRIGTGNALANALNGNAGADSLGGLGGDDTLEGGAGNDVLDGGADTDLARYLGNSADFTIEQLPDGSVRVTDDNAADGDEGIDVLANVESLGFADTLIATGESAGALLYEAAATGRDAPAGTCGADLLLGS